MVVALLWVVHPVHSAAVDYISGRADSLAFAFSCGAWLAYLGAPQQAVDHTRLPATRRPRLLLLLGFVPERSRSTWVVIFVVHLLFTKQSTARHRSMAIVAAGVILAVYAGPRQLPGPRPQQTTAALTWGGVARCGVSRALGDYVQVTLWPRLHMERTVVEERMLRPGWGTSLRLPRRRWLAVITAAVFILGVFKGGTGRRLRIFGARLVRLRFSPDLKHCRAKRHVR